LGEFKITNYFVERKETSGHKRKCPDWLSRGKPCLIATPQSMISLNIKL